MLYSHVTLLMLRVVDVVAKTSVQQNTRMLVAEIPGDIQIGFLFPLHKQVAGTEGCGQIWEQYGIQRSEIAIKTVEKLNKRLPFKLGISIRDSCWTDRISMEQTIAFLREGVAQCQCCQTPGCQKKVNPVVAIVGPAKSSTTIAAQNLLQVFRIPQIGYSATSIDLSDKERFGYYLRVVPSDTFQARAIISLLKHFKWTYVAVVYTAGNYGERGFEELESMLTNEDVCIAHSEKIKSLASAEEFRKSLKQIVNLKIRPQVIVCFCEGETVRKMFEAQRELRKKNNNVTRFQWIGSDGWADRRDVVDGLQEEAAGSFSIRIHSPKIESFEDHYFNLNPENHTVNPWFRDFWQEKFECQFTIPKEEIGLKNQCTGKEQLRDGYEQDPKLSQVSNAVRVVADALEKMYSDRCGLTTEFKNCPEMATINGTLLYQYMINVTFTDEFEQNIRFDQNGDAPAWYDILNYVGEDGGYKLAGDYRQIADGNYSLLIPGNDIKFFDNTYTVPESVCSKPCGSGQRKRETMACCWICENCAANEYLNETSNECHPCPLAYWPDEERLTCKALPVQYIEWSAFEVLGALIFAIVGIIITLCTIGVFLKHNSTPVVKSTTRELSYIILGGIIGCYGATLAILAKPTFASCFISRTLPPIAFSAVYAALLTKTNRIARILAGSKKRILTKKPRFLSTFSQVVITWIIVGIQIVIVAVGVIKEMPRADHDSNLLPRDVVLICLSSTPAFLSPFLWNLFLIILCTLYAIKTRNLPENFNEAKYIGFTMYCTLVVWCAFIVLHFGTGNKAITSSLSFSLSATIALAILFFPKIYIILLHPEKNVRASYTTTKLIRCHFGNSQGMSEASTKNRSISKARSSTQSLSYSTSSTKHDIHTQTDTLPTTSLSSQPLRFKRTFSVATSHHKKKNMDDDVIQLIDSCRRYQNDKMQSTEIKEPTNLLLQVPEQECEDEPLTEMMKDTIQNSMRTVLSTVNHGGSLGGLARPRTGTEATRQSLLPSPLPPDPQLDPEEDPFEEEINMTNKGMKRQKMNITDSELENITVKQLNQLLQGQERATVSQLKQKRRTLKNRHYALRCRERRVQKNMTLSAENNEKDIQIQILTQQLCELRNRLAFYEGNSPQYLPIQQTFQPSHLRPCGNFGANDFNNNNLSIVCSQSTPIINYTTSPAIMFNDNSRDF
uniref:G_PROTEIN_RECEP_F3_4 domain-containing protein n=1 Tax=Rhabditophanes sp. KR3021 TaxID=114890 RepID=A0AC35UA74_9BILA